MKIDKTQLITYILTIVTLTSIYTFKNLRKQRELMKRIKRNEAFLVESEALKKKYPNGGDDEGKAMAAELIALMNKYGL
ncbi:hypothetical protein SEA_CLUBPENGUIN_30 [Streptomyces phage ClubPenguin]|nr:hypothetical protein SEA_CLUBPENGUIN_30 [Streptomyces phage ClubPenguin]